MLAPGGPRWTCWSQNTLERLDRESIQKLPNARPRCTTTAVKLLCSLLLALNYGVGDWTEYRRGGVRALVSFSLSAQPQLPHAPSNWRPAIGAPGRGRSDGKSHWSQAGP